MQYTEIVKRYLHCHNTYVGKKDAKFQNIEVEYFPNPPVLGQLLTVTVSGTISKLIL